MENHPVPKNVLTVEFKLFGPLTVKQFARLLGVAMACLVIFITPIPRLISIPIIFVVGILGAASALLEGFDVKIWGMVKAVFSTTQYVWKNEHEVPEVLKEDLAKETTKKSSKKVSATKDSDKLNELSIDRILDARSKAQTIQDSQQQTSNRPKINNAMIGGKTTTNTETSGTEELESDNFSKIYSNTYQQTESLDESTRRRAIREQLPPVQKASGLASNSAPADLMQSGANMQTVVQPVRNSAPRNSLKAPATSQISLQQLSEEEKTTLVTNLTQEVKELRQMLQTKDTEARKEITEAIKEKFAQLQVLIGKKAAEEASSTMNAIFGVIVSSGEQPIPGANVGLTAQNNPGKLLASAQSGQDGRFKLDLAGLKLDDVDKLVVRIVHPQFTFPDFKINPDQKQLPAYKFRAN